MNNLLRKYGIYIVFAVAGAIGGYLYWYYIGCNTGTCPLTSKWYSTSIYGAILGYLSGDVVFSIFKSTRDKNVVKNKND